MACRERTDVRAHVRCDVPGERGDIVLGWLLRVVAAVAIAGIALFDVISVGTARLAVEDQAVVAARAASDAWAGRHDVQGAFDTAWASAIEADPTNEIDPTSFQVDADGAVHLTVHRVAPTFVVQHVGALRDWATVQASGTGRSGQ